MGGWRKKPPPRPPKLPRLRRRDAPPIPKAPDVFDWRANEIVHGSPGNKLTGVIGRITSLYRRTDP